MTYFYYKDQYTSNLQLKYINITINIIDVCNFTCTYCYNRKFRKNNVLDLQKLKIFLNYLCDVKKMPIKCNIIGGEPFLHSQLFDFISYLNKNDIHCTIYTNMSSLIKTYLEIMNSFKNIKIVFSIHNKFFYEIYSIDLIRSLKEISNNASIDSYEIRLMFDLKNISLINNILTKFQNNCVIFPIIYDNINYLIDDKYKYDILSNKCQNNLILNKEIIDEDDSYLLFDLNRRLINGDKYSFCNKWICFAGIDSLYIHSNGDISPCEQLYLSKDKIIIGNIAMKNYDNIKFHPIICKEKICDCQILSKKIHMVN